MSESSGVKKRSRASVACAVCRARRTKCTILPGETRCRRCQSSGSQCVITGYDERKRPVSKAHLEFLNSRIELLEKALNQEGIDVSNILPEYPHDAQDDDQSQGFDEDQQEDTAVETQVSQQNTLSGRVLARGPWTPESVGQVYNEPTKEAPPLLEPTEACAEPIQESQDVLKSILAAQGQLFSNKETAQSRYCHPFANLHVYAELETPTFSHEWEQDRRINRILRDIPTGLQDYLLTLYWEHNASFIAVVSKDAFYREQDSHSTKHFCGLLRLCMLAVGYRYADPKRVDVQKISADVDGSILHREALYIHEQNTKYPAHRSDVQSLLLLADSEFALGRDNTGSMFINMACRAVRGLGLHRLDSSVQHDEEEVLADRMLFSACLLYDRIFSLWLGHPPILDLYTIDLITITLSDNSQARLQALVQRAFIELLEFVPQINGFCSRPPEIRDSEPIKTPYELDRRLRRWYRQLPPELNWTTANLASMPSIFVSLHQQYYVLLIMIHRAPASYHIGGRDSTGDALIYPHHLDRDETSRYMELSRDVCLESVQLLLRIFAGRRRSSQHHCLYLVDLQHIGTAITTLLGTVRVMRKDNDQPLLRHTQELSDDLQKTSARYHSAAKMVRVVKTMLEHEQTHLRNRSDMDAVSGNIPDARMSDSIRVGRENKHQNVALIGNTVSNSNNVNARASSHGYNPISTSSTLTSSSLDSQLTQQIAAQRFSSKPSSTITTGPVAMTASDFCSDLPVLEEVSMLTPKSLHSAPSSYLSDQSKLTMPFSAASTEALRTRWQLQTTEHSIQAPDRSPFSSISQKPNMSFEDDLGSQTLTWDHFLR